MPELPEVETVRLQLLDKVIGKTINDVEVFHSKAVEHDENIDDKLSGKMFKHIERIGKLLIFSFQDEEDLFMLAHLKMTGQFFYVDQNGDVVGGGHSLSESEKIDFPHKHSRVAFHFSDHTTLYFNDMRLFGYTKLADVADVAQAKSRFGPEPINPNFDCEWFSQKLKRRNTPIKAALLDQTFVAGLGNIYVDEALWRAKVSPTRKASEISDTEAKLLCKTSGDVMKESIKVGGTTFQHFADTDGKSGNFTKYLQVFGQQGKPCSRCQTTIEKTRCAGRGTHYCPKCQK